MRSIKTHIVNPANDRLEISVIDEPGHSGANHLYKVTGFDTSTNPSDPFTQRQSKKKAALRPANQRDRGCPFFGLYRPR